MNSTQDTQITPYDPNPRLLYSSTFPNIAYDLLNGLFWRIDSKTKATTRELPLDDSSRVICRSSITGKNTSRKGAILAWEMINGKELPVDHVVYFKDMNEGNLRGYNLGCCTKVEWSLIKDATANLSGYAKLVPHRTEVYSYKVRYKQGGFSTHQSFHDITAAKAFLRMLVCTGTVLLNKYIVSA